MMKFYFACSLLLALLPVYSAKGNNTSSLHGGSSNAIQTSYISDVISTTSLIIPFVTTSIKASSTPVINASSTYSPSPGNTSAINPNSTMNPNMTSTVHPNSTVNPNMSSTVHQNASTSVPSNVTVLTSSPSHSMSPVPPTKPAGKDNKDYDNMKKRMWIAASFAIIFALTTVILGYLVYRQRKINRELEGDPATSRLL